MSQPQFSETALPTDTSNIVDNLQIIQNPDGTITRPVQFPTTPPTPDPDNSLSQVLTKDVPLNTINNTWIRLFLPRELATDNSSSPKKLPLIVYYHGGGFVFLSASTTINHDFCFNLAHHIPAVIASVDYRLAPESRLPAAYDDAVEALHWLRTTDEKWAREFADLSNCYLMGTSAGGNMAYHVGLRVSTTADDLDPLKIKGLILHHAFFGGSQRTDSETRLANDPVLPLERSDLMWDLGLPEGADRDYKYCNPTVADEGDEIRFDEIKRLRWKVLIAGCVGDPLIDRQVVVAETLKSRGIEVVEHFDQGYHGIELFEPTKAEPLSVRIKDFVY